AKVKCNIAESQFGFLVNTYNGMLDLYSDFTMIQAQTGIHVEVLEMCDLDAKMEDISIDEIKDKLVEVEDMFTISEDSRSEKLAKKPTSEQLEWACKIAVAQERLVQDRKLDALTYYYHGAPGNEYERLQSGCTVGQSLLTAQGVPCAGEGDLKTNIAMKICDTLDVGGSYCEIITTDYVEGTMLFGHDGPFHLKIAEGKPILRRLGLYHGKQGSGVAVEAKVKTGPVILPGLSQTIDRKLKFIISEGISTDGETVQIGNTQTPVKFPTDPDTYYERWFDEAPIHHCAMSIGRNVDLFKKTANMLNIPYVVV